MIDLLNRLKEGRNWVQVAALLGEYSPAMWMLIAAGKRHATLKQTNLVRAACGLPPLTQTPAEAVAASGVDRVIPLSKQPNTALLVAVSGDVVKVNLKTGVLADGATVGVSCTACNGHGATSSRRQGRFYLSLSDMDVSGLKTIRGQTGNFEKIASAASAARLAIDVGNEESDLQLWQSMIQ